MKNKPIKVGEWLVDVESNQMQLIKDSEQQVIFEPKVMNVLACLIEHAGQVVSTETLIDRCWPNQFLSDNPLHKCINQLRKAFKDTSRSSTYIQTVPKRGYRLLAPVDTEFDPQKNHDIKPPYPGPRAFNDSESKLFYGRDYQVQELLYLIKQRSISNHKGNILLIGEAGVGKSSLIHAGLRAELASFNIDFDTIDGHASEQVFKQQLEGLKARYINSDSSPHKTDIKPALILIDHLELTSLIMQTDDQSLRLDTTQRATQLLKLANQLNQTTEVTLMICLRPFDLAMLRKTEYHSLCKGELYLLDKPSTTEIYLAITQPATQYQLDFEVSPKTGMTLAQELHKLCIVNQLSLKQLQGLLYELCQRTSNRQLTFESFEQIKRERNDLWLNRKSHIIKEFQTTSETLSPLLKKLIKVKFDGAFHIKLTEAPLANFDNPPILVLISQLIDNKLLTCHIKNDQVFIKFIDQAVIHALPFTQQWVNKHYQSLISKEHISANCELWLTHNKSNGYLLSPGKPLEDAKQLLELNQKDLAHNHREYIQASLKAVNQKQRFKRLMISAVCILSLISTSALLVANNARISQQNARHDAEQLISFMNQELKRELIPLGKLDLMESLGIEILEYFRNSGINNVNATLHTAMAQKLLGEVYTQQGQRNKAKNHFEQAQTLLNEILHQQPQLPKAIFELGQVNYWKGYLAYRDTHYSQAKEFWNQYYQLSEQLLTLDEHNSQYQNELSYAHNNLGTLALLLHQHQDALYHFQESAQIKLQLIAESSIDVQIELVDTYSWIARTYDYLGQTKKSHNNYEKQLHSLISINKHNNSSKSQLYYLAVAHQNMANMNFILNNLEDALADLKRSLTILNELIDYEPSNVEYQESKVFTLTMIGQIYRLLQQYDLSQLHLSQSLTMAQSLAQPQTQSKKAHFYLSKIRYEMGRYQQSQDHLKSAYNNYQRALTQNLNESNDSYHQELVALIHLRLAEIAFMEFGSNASKQQAEAHLRKAQELFVELIKNNKSVRYRLPYCLITFYLNERDTTQCFDSNSNQLSEPIEHPEFTNNFDIPIAN